SLMQPRSVAENFEAGVATMGWIPKLDWRQALFGRRSVRRAHLERGDQLLQGRTREVSHDPTDENGLPANGNGLKYAPIQARFALMSNVTERDAQAVVGEAERAGETLARVREEIGKSVFGQERVVEMTLAAVLAGGHVLLVGAPGLAKTRLVE